MRNLIVLTLLGSGCAVHTAGSSGVTRAEYRGGDKVMFTNASPAAMCELRMSSDAQPDYGDNWLSSRLASGASIELHVRPGAYKAMWSTCPASGGYYAATLWHETAVEVKGDTQLYAYVADGTAPTTHARVLGVDYTVVRFQGQPIGPIIAANAHPEQPAVEGTVATAPAHVEKLGAAAFIDPSAAKKPHKMKRASLARTHDVAGDTVAYHAR